MNLFDDRYAKEDLIGRGAFSEVWRVTDTYTNTVMALKIFTSNSDIDEDGLEMLKREFSLMIDADHQNLLRPMFFGVSSESKLPYLILPYCEGGNIKKMMGRMTEPEAWKLIRDTASALAYLHALNPPIIHQDIKPANILIGNDGFYKLSDFGVSIQARSTLSNTNYSDSIYISAGTTSYMAPERFSRDNLPIMANDVYSLGATVYQMLSGYLPFGADGGLAQKKGAEVPVLPGNYSPQLKKVLEDCLSEEPRKRPTASRLEGIAIDELPNDETIVGPVPGGGGSMKHKLVGFVAVVAIIILAAYFLLPRLSSESNVPVIKGESEVIECPPQASEPKAIDIPEAKKPKVVEPKPVHADKPEPATAPEPVAKPSIESINLGYAVWEGESVNGKPNGEGTMTFHKAHRIDSRDEQGRIAQSGDKVKGVFVNGHLEYGTWIKSDGGQEDILIGQ